MNDNTNLFTHLRTDPNAWLHSFIGYAVFCLSTGFGFIFSASVYVLSIGSLLSLAAGISIEVWQRLHGGSNTNRESVMDTLTTWLFFLYPIAQWTKK